jgi:nucleoside-diphosphate-sugar epimerase
MTHPIIRQDIDGVLSQNLPWEKFKDKKVLITGANGFIPAYFVELFMGLNAKFGWNIGVTALVRNNEKAKKRFSAYAGNRHLEILCQDVCDPIHLNDKVDYIIHAASQASPKFYKTDPVGTLRPNVIGTSHLLELAKLHGVSRFLYFSSAEVYGDKSGALPIHENQFGAMDPCALRSCYGESKRMGENMCVSWTAQYQVPALIVRPFHTYGPGLALDDGRVFADFISDVVHRRDIQLHSDGSAVRSYCYLSDALAAYATVLLKGNAGEAYNVGNAVEAVSVMELAHKLVALYPQFSLKVTQKKKSENYLATQVDRVIPDTGKIEKLGWHPSVSIEEGFKKTIDYYLND